MLTVMQHQQLYYNLHRHVLYDIAQIQHLLKNHVKLKSIPVKMYVNSCIQEKKKKNNMYVTITFCVW